MAPHPYVDSLAARGQEALNGAKTNALQSLKLALEDLPVRAAKLADPNEPKKKGTAEDIKAARDQAAKNVLETVCKIDAKDLPKAVQGLSDDERDTLMKYLFRGMSERTETDGKKTTTYDCQILLKAHDEVCKVSGLGPVIRSIHTQLEV
jgi:actin related protein 2/3 complex subunit 5